MSMILNVNTDAVVSYTNKLEKLHRSAFPNAIRTALNSTAFDVKKNELMRSSKKHFINRKPSFFKANSRVEMAKGFDIKAMKSVIGMIGRGKSDDAVDDLEQQEHGGKIGGKSFIPLDSARTSGRYNKNVRKANRISKLRPMVSTRHVSGRNEGQRFAKSVAKAGAGGFVISTFKNKRYIWRVNSLNRTRSGQFKLTGLYSYEKGRNVIIKKPAHFMKEASLKSNGKMEKFFIKEAQKQFMKALKK